jgi:uncharacterized SAM-dependent methyltransferase
MASLDAETDARLREIWKRAYAARTRDDLRRLYGAWADTYDADHEAVGFDGHRAAAELLSHYVPYPDVSPVLDAGAGTGAAGEALAAIGFGNLTAVDLSAEMLDRAEAKNIYGNLVQADLGQPLDAFPANFFSAGILVGVFSYGQAPAHTLDEMVRLVKPGGVIVFTMRTDFFEEDAMGVRSRMDALESADAWQLSEISEPAPYLPKKDPDAMYRIWCYRVLPRRIADHDPDFASAVRNAMTSGARVKRIDHCHIWNSMASRLYDRYIECPEYYLNDAEEEILRTKASQIIGDERIVVELGCGSARKVSHVLEAALEDRSAKPLTYIPIDLSHGALASTRAEIEHRFDGRVAVDPRQGHFNDILPTLPGNGGKVIFFFGGSIGNIETIEETIAFLRAIRDRMQAGDRFLVGMDLHKDEAILRAAYEAGPRNFSFFANMIRRINTELGANFDVNAFVQESTYDEEPSYEGIANRCVNLKLVSERPQKVYIRALELEATIEPGDAIQVGTSRKFAEPDIPALFALAGLSLSRQWYDSRRYLTLAECVRDDSADRTG